MRITTMITSALVLALTPMSASGRNVDAQPQLSPVQGQAQPQARPPQTACRSASASIDRNFPAGAFVQCEATGGRSFRLTIAPEDPGNINCSPWFAFRLKTKRKQRIMVELSYARCGHRYWPKTSTDGVNWTYLPSGDVQIKGEGADRTALLSIAVKDKPVFVAGQEILPPSTYTKWMGAISHSPMAQRSLLGRSAEGRPISVITIAAPGAQPRETVVLIGRQHPPEVSGALAMFPFVETLLGDDPVAQRFRERFQTIVVPLLNPDGVVGGYWRHNSDGVDLNRDWGPFTQPETQLMQKLLQEIADDPNRQLRLMLDFHSTNRDVFYTIPDDLPTDPPFFTRDWLARLQQRMPDYQVSRDATHVAGRPNSKAYVFDTYGVPGVTFELGDETDRVLIKRIGREAAIAMMETLLSTTPK